MIAVIITARASFAKFETILEHLPEVRLYLCGSALLDHYGNLQPVVAQKFPQMEVVPVYSHMEGGLPVTMAASAGQLTTALATHLHRDKPRLVMVMADRAEVLAAAQAAANLNIPLAHIQGGERTGSIDDRCRDAITTLSQYHFPATRLAGLRVYNLTGSEKIWVTGCPSIDVAKRALLEPPVSWQELSGAGSDIDPHGPFALVVQHPDTDVWEQSFQQMTQTLRGVSNANLPVMLQWPNADAGTERISKAIRMFRNYHPTVAIRTLPSFPPSRFLRLLSQARVLVGNSSAGIREGSFLGVPVLNVGDRQRGRERGPNVVNVPYNEQAITEAVKRQLAHGPYASSGLYGDGEAGKRIAEVVRGL
jgi:UDP-hydrolysing UDP-N-acetyl-D-glucosamine 2-epimerase